MSPASPPPPAYSVAAALRAQLRAGDPGYHWRSLFFLLAWMILFGTLSGMSFDARGAATLVVAIVLHDLGHLAGMKLLGVREPRIFFVSLLNADPQQLAKEPSRARRGAVLLSGPLPGALLAFALVLAGRPEAKGLEWNLVLALAGINGLSLLPFEPFDGGHLLQLELPRPLRLLDVLALLVITAALAALAFVRGWVSLGIVAFAVLSLTGRRINAWRVSREVFGGSTPEAPRIEQANDATLAALHQAVQQKVIQPVFYPRPEKLLAVTAEWARRAYERALPPLAAPGAVALIAGHLAGLALVAGSLALLFGR